MRIKDVQTSSGSERRAPVAVRGSFTLALLASALIGVAVGTVEGASLGSIGLAIGTCAAIWLGVAFDAHVRRCSHTLRLERALVLVPSRPSREPPRPSGTSHAPENRAA